MTWLTQELVTLVLGLIAAFAGAVKWIDVRMKGRAAEQRQQLMDMAAMLARTDHQLHPNSGQSIADKVNSLVASVARLESTFEAERAARGAATVYAHEAAARAEVAVYRAEEAVERAEGRGKRKAPRRLMRALGQAFTEARLGEIDDDEL